MSSLPPTRKPAFAWQAGLILLPVLIMAVVALRVIGVDRTAVEREARQRAEEAAQQYTKGLERQLGLVWVEYEGESGRWSDYLANVTGAWPGSKQRSQLERELSPPPDPPYPGWRAAEVFPSHFSLSPEGRFQDGLEYNPAPRPPAWFTALAPNQQAAWEAITAAAAAKAGVEDVEKRIARFAETEPESEARLNAQFIGLRTKWATLPPAEAMSAALEFTRQGTMVAARHTQTNGEGTSVSWALPSSREYREAVSAAGLPLVNLAFREALRYARLAGPSEELWKEIPDQVLRAPSPLVPGLLDQLQEIAGTNSPLRASVGAWRTLWNARLKLHEIAEVIRQSGKLSLEILPTGETRSRTMTNFWMEYDQSRWLCLLHPETNWMLCATNGGQTRTFAGIGTAVRFLPKSVVEQGFGRALEASRVKPPEYLGLVASLEGEPLDLPERWSPARSAHSKPVLLAQASGAVSALGKLLPGRGQPEMDWEWLPSHPRFTVQLYLADPAVLFASYRRHALLMAGLVGASVFAALIGVVASWHAFRRQLRLNELKSNFVSSVSHELRSPIASVRLMAESLERGKVSETPKQQEYFRFIVQECRRLSALIENVLDFSRIEQGRKQYDFEPTDLVALTRQTVRLMETYAAERNVQLRLQLSDALPAANGQLSADGKALQQALVNLIDNALKHSPAGGTVTVGLEGGMQNAECRMQNVESGVTPAASRVTHHESRTCLWVEDHGEGIPASEHQKIFERFYRRGSELRRQTQGVGIGLSIVKHIVEAHGGRVVIRSAPGQGSRFTIELPVASDLTSWNAS